MGKKFSVNVELSGRKRVKVYFSEAGWRICVPEVVKEEKRQELIRDSSFSFGPGFGDFVEILAGVGKVDILFDNADLV